jgi:hypothetical protein
MGDLTYLIAPLRAAYLLNYEKIIVLLCEVEPNDEMWNHISHFHHVYWALGFVLTLSTYVYLLHFC